MLADKLRRVYAGDAWHGASTTAILSGITAEMAVQRPLPNVHTIAELVAHLITWREFGVRVLSGDVEYRVDVNSEIDWPVFTELSEEAWHVMLAKLDDTQERMLRLLDTMTDEELDAPAGWRPFSFRVIADGVIDHDIYHGGQIALIKKLLQ